MHENHRRLIRAAVGRYVAFCEGDDYWHDSMKLARQVQVMDSRPSLSGSHTDFDHVDAKRGVWHRRRNYASKVRRVTGPLTTYEQLVARNLVQTCTLVIRTEAARAYVDSDFSRHHFSVGDWPLCLFATSQYGPFAFLPHSTATYRRVAVRPPTRATRRRSGAWRTSTG